ncbi:uncharacterized protein J8A68_005798 [[Candida] subhashii]|uniref:Uncharacterized protein n=1 Tax=[Candida] subhashii TaxID=561895 RepID=A0A8J5Q5B6_9ASCO|nr:uncharacterized protein J8A68_005798 [[Candida] subhashii]KAG7660681.1 hypothetical protein J8A68_005798 [[Candida] subhashii]
MSDSTSKVRVPRKQVRQKKSLIETYVTPKFKKDLKFGAVAFVLMCIGIFHYAYIMRQLVLDPYMEKKRLIPLVIVFLVNVIFLGYLLLWKAYPIVYAEEIAQEKAETEQLRQAEQEQRLKKKE